MPGHIKLVKGAVDPDPTEFLLPSIDMKRADQQKPYDSKKSVWIPDPKTGGYREGILEDGDLEDPAAKCVVAGNKCTKIPNSQAVLFKLDMRSSPTSSLRWAGLTLPSLRSARTWST